MHARRNKLMEWLMQQVFEGSWYLFGQHTYPLKCDKESEFR